MVQNSAKASVWKYLVIILIAVVLVSAIAFKIYAGDYYRASEDALKLIEESDSAIDIQVIQDEHQKQNTKIIFAPKDADVACQTGMIFYPGGKVQYEAYAPLLAKLAKEGVYCVLLQMPANLAVLDIHAADDIKEAHPEIRKWYMCGHSLGGSMAATCVAKHSEGIEGVILLAAYSTEDLKDSGVRVLSIYGSNDGVLGMEKYEKYRDNLPEETEEQVIEGGCHAYFGDYGAQDGDGSPAISREEQQAQTVEAIKSFMQE